MAASATNADVFNADLEAQSNGKAAGGTAGRSVLLVEWPLMAGGPGGRELRGLMLLPGRWRRWFPKGLLPAML